MTLAQIFPLVSGIFVFLLGLLVIGKNYKSKSNIYFGLFCLGTTFWLIGTYMMFGAKTDAQAIFWDRIIYIGGILNPIFIYHFGLYFLELKQNKWILRIGYSLAAFFLIFLWTDYFASGLYKYSWGVHTRAGILHHFFLVYFIAFMMMFFFDVIKELRKTTGIKKFQIKYIFYALLSMMIIGGPAFLPAYGIDIYPFSYLSGAIFACIVAYAITRYRLMDIRIVIRSLIVYLLVIITFEIFLLGSSFVLDNFFRYKTDATFFAINSSYLILVLLLFTPVKDFFTRLVNKYIFKSLYSSQQAIEKMSKESTSIIDLNKLLHLIVNTLKDYMGLSRMGILLFDKETRNYSYKVGKVVGFNIDNGISLVRNNYLIEKLIETKKPVILQELEAQLKNSNTYNRETIADIKKLIVHVKRIEASLCLPLIANNKLIGVIVLGEKNSNEAYTKQDLELLEIISSQAAVSIENAKLHKEVEDFSKNLQKKVHEQTTDIREKNEELKRLLDARSEFLSIASHQLRTPLAAIRGYTSMLKQGDYGDFNNDARTSIEYIYDSSVRMIELVNNLLNVNRLEKGTINLNVKDVSVNQIIEECIEDAEYSAKNKGILVKYVNSKNKLPLIKGDYEKIKNSIGNIINNAVLYTVKGKVEIRASVDNESIKVEVKDTGIGIEKEDIDKIFKSFSRGKGGAELYTQGTGLGLYIAKSFIEMHGGKISVYSEGKDKGSVFTIELPLKSTIENNIISQ